MPRTCSNCGIVLFDSWEYEWCEECGRTANCRHGNPPAECDECLTESDEAFDRNREG